MCYTQTCRAQPNGSLTARALECHIEDLPRGTGGKVRRHGSLPSTKSPHSCEYGEQNRNQYPTQQGPFECEALCSTVIARVFVGYVVSIARAHLVVSRKKAAVVEEVEEDEFEQESEEDMFAVSESEPVSMSSNAQNAERRQAAFEEIKAMYDLPRAQRKPGQMPTSVLATVVHATTTKEEAEQLKDILRMWRVSGMRVTDQAGQDIIGELDIIQ